MTRGWILALATLSACRGCLVEHASYCGELGCLLEHAPTYARDTGPGRGATPPSSSEKFRPRPMRIKVVEVGTGPTRFSHGTLFADRPRPGVSFSWPCASEPTEVTAWLFTQAHWEGRAALGLDIGGLPVQLPLPDRANHLVRVALPVVGGCAAGGSLTVRIVDAPQQPAILMTVPRLLHAEAEPLAPVILLSIDTLRADYWDGREERPAPLARLFDDSVRFTEALSPTGTTHPSHRVMLSGRWLADTWAKEVADDLAIAAVLRAGGYDTAAFVGGGYMRPSFGFGMGLPSRKRRGLAGFADGFSIYLERLEVAGAVQARQGLSRQDFDLALARSTYTLGPSLERSLRLFAEQPTAPWFHFLHGYDVHEARDVPRFYFEAARAAHTGDPDFLEECLERVEFHGDDRHVVHWHNPGATRDRDLGEAVECHAAVAGLMYEARVRSVEAMLGRYLHALDQLGVYERALIVLTSDHGETLLDERRRDGSLHWGHNELLVTNLRVPLWIKAPGARGGGRESDRIAGLADLRPTIGALLGLDLGESVGVDLLDDTGERQLPLELEQMNKETGVVLRDGALCAWRKPGASGGSSEGLRVHAGTVWLEPDRELKARCRVRRAVVVSGDASVEPELTAAEREELEALGYLR